MAGRKGRWVRVKEMNKEEKEGIAETCTGFIEEILKPRFLPEIRPTPFNYPVDILGRWRGSRYSFITRYRSGCPDNPGEEFDHAFARLDHFEERIDKTRFDLMWHRHIGRWHLFRPDLPLDEALRLIAEEPLLHPV
ncbi:MAG: hypothetical protein D6754_02255 [Alphaproteobacteria bacterium]|nr:MAG: hypothetical protein D6754_02255 [Alphaproteobacteria bacterium]